MKMTHSSELQSLLKTVKDADLMASQRAAAEKKRRELLAANKAAARSLLASLSEVSYVTRITKETSE